MKRITLLFSFLCLQLYSFGQSPEFEGVLIYELHTYNGEEKSSSISQIKYSIKGNLWRAELVGNEVTNAPVNYSLLVNLKSKEATILANISNTKMAIDINESFFQIEKTLLNNQIETINYIDRVQKSILFLGVDISSLIKGDIKNLPDSYNNSNKNDTKASIEDKQKKVEYGGQCKATTKKGTRCSRTAGSNGYCWQHS